jgi:hypothetical protein
VWSRRGNVIGRRPVVVRGHEWDNVVGADDLGDASYVGADYGSATAQGFSADQREAFVQAREHKDIDAVHDVGHDWGGLVAEEADWHVATLIAMT